MTVTRRPSTNQTAPAKETQRISAGSLWATTNPSFLAGNLRPAQGQYANQQALLECLPPAPEGYAWRIKMYANRSQSEHAPAWDVVFELEENYQR